MSPVMIRTISESRSVSVGFTSGLGCTTSEWKVRVHALDPSARPAATTRANVSDRRFPMRQA